MYREIEGYEEALYLCSDVIDLTDDLCEKIRYGEKMEDILKDIETVEECLSKMKKTINKG